MPNDLERLQGSWNVAALELEQQKMPSGMLAAARVVIAGDRFQSLGMGAVYEGTLKLDEAAVPKAFDPTFTAGPEKGNTSLGIYDLDGEQWRICLTTRGGSRPATFSTAPGSGGYSATASIGTADHSCSTVPRTQRSFDSTCRKFHRFLTQR